MYNHPDKDRIFDYIGNHKFKFVIMTTNAGLMDRVPNIDELIISFNGGTKESYEYTTGLDFDRTVANIKSLYPQIATLRNAEIHCLIWEGNKGTEEQLKRLWADFPGRVRLSYKYDNQFEEDKTLPEYRKKERVYCDYLDTFSIMPNGQVISCAHDFKMSTNWGNAFEDDIDELNYHPERIRKREEHVRGEFTGLCEKCNYNTPVDDRTKYIKERDNG
jgi:radical SAM protein with 4Fe4S-binding SPASM domain